MKWLFQWLRDILVRCVVQHCICIGSVMWVVQSVSLPNTPWLLFLWQSLYHSIASLVHICRQHCLLAST